MNMNPEKSSRSVFIGNIPYDTTEEQLREIFSQAGTITSFRLVYDRDTGKPKGYGFCEYVDVETAQSAMRNLNNHEFKGRQLRVDIAGGDFGREERGVVGPNIGPVGEPSPYGEPVEPEQAPEAISRAVASLPPEQMFELMKQMKLCIQNNPAEARNMLLQNPQLAYALLQAQIVMKIVDPKVAVAMLHRRSDQIPPPAPTASAIPNRSAASQQLPFLDNIDNSSSLPGLQPATATLLPTPGTGMAMGATRPASSLPNMVSAGGRPRASDQRMGIPGGLSPGQHDVMRQRGPAPVDLMVGARSRGPVPQDSFDPRVRGSVPVDVVDPRARPLGPQARGPIPQDARPRGPGPQDLRPRGPMPSAADVRPMVPLDPRGQRMPGGGGPAARPQAPGGGYSEAAPAGASAAQLNQQEQEKAQLIMQVLQLSDEQIQMLPPDQRQSILILKEQIARSSANQMR